MSLVPVTRKKEIAVAISRLAKQLRSGGGASVRRIGWQGGHEDYTVYWRKREQFWSCPAFPEADRHIQFFGTELPNPPRMLTIICEINPARKGVNARNGGLIVRDDTGAEFLAHSGKIGGGRPGVGKEAFLNFYAGHREQVTIKGEAKEYNIIGRIGSHALPRQLGEFIREVERFKAAAKAGTLGGPRSGRRLLRSFRPEFSGKRKGYKHRNPIEANCDHGMVVNGLAKQLQELGHEIQSDVNRDLVVVDESDHPTILFEIKPAVNTSSLYGAIGQFFYHSVEDNPPPRRVLVLPEKPDARNRAVFSKLNLEVLVYTLNQDQPVFPELQALLKRQ